MEACLCIAMLGCLDLLLLLLRILWLSKDLIITRLLTLLRANDLWSFQTLDFKSSLKSSTHTYRHKNWINKKKSSNVEKKEKNERKRNLRANEKDHRWPMTIKLFLALQLKVCEAKLWDQNDERTTQRITRQLKIFTRQTNQIFSSYHQSLKLLIYKEIFTLHKQLKDLF